MLFMILIFSHLGMTIKLWYNITFNVVRINWLSSMLQTLRCKDQTIAMTTMITQSKVTVIIHNVALPFNIIITVNCIYLYFNLKVILNYTLCAVCIYFRCQDYILIDRGSFGTTEICGNSTSGDSVLELQSRNFTVYFRTSEEKTIKGFQMYIVCFNKEERNLEGM